MLLAKKIAAHAIVGTITGRLSNTFSGGENSARVYVNILSDSSDNNFLHWEIDSQAIDVAIVELTYGGAVWIALDAVNSGASDRSFETAVFEGQYSEQTDQLSWQVAGDISGLTSVSSSRITTGPNRIRAVYDVTGGDSGTVAAHGLGILLPDNATVIRSSIEVITAFDSGGSGETVSLGITSDDAAGILGLSDLGSTGFIASIQDDGKVANYTTKTTAARELIATVAGEEATSGKLILWVDYIFSE